MIPNPMWIEKLDILHESVGTSCPSEEATTNLVRDLKFMMYIMISDMMRWNWLPR